MKKVIYVKITLVAKPVPTKVVIQEIQPAEIKPIVISLQQIRNLVRIEMQKEQRTMTAPIKSIYNTAGRKILAATRVGAQAFRHMSKLGGALSQKISATQAQAETRPVTEAVRPIVEAMPARMQFANSVQRATAHPQMQAAQNIAAEYVRPTAPQMRPVKPMESTVQRPAEVLRAAETLRRPAPVEKPMAMKAAQASQAPVPVERPAVAKVPQVQAPHLAPREYKIPTPARMNPMLLHMFQRAKARV